MRGQTKSYITKMAAVCLAAAAWVATAADRGPLYEGFAAESSAAPAPTPRARRAPARSYREFPHAEKAHQIDCGSCHKFPSKNWNKVRDKDAFADITDYPEHSSCVRCHTQQFFRGATPAICSICHTNPSPRNSARHPFPNPREVFDKSPKGKTATSDFVVAFPHDKHIEIVAAHDIPKAAIINASFRRTQDNEASCKVCHQTLSPQGKSADEYITKPPADLGEGFWLKKGTFKSAPIGHTTCFTCHSTESGMNPLPNNCAACHKLEPKMPPADFDAKLAASMKLDDKVSMDAWRSRTSSGKFSHEFTAHVDMSCSTCHSVGTMKTEDPATTRVPITACATCHVTATSDDGGALNFEMDQRKAKPSFECTKCHVTFGKQPVPASHTKAIADAK